MTIRKKKKKKTVRDSIRKKAQKPLSTKKAVESPMPPLPENPPRKKRRNPGAGDKPFVPTDEQRKNVEILAGLGLRHDEICLLVDNPKTGKAIDLKTLRKRFAVELERGAPKMHAQVAQSIARKAIGDGPQAVTAAIWYSKCRMGWKERVAVEVEDKSGVLVAPPAASVEEWIAAQAARANRIAAATSIAANGARNGGASHGQYDVQHGTSSMSSTSNGVEDDE